MVFKIKGRRMERVDAIDPMVARVFHMAVQDNGILVVWGGYQVPEKVIRLKWNRGFIRLDDVMVKG